MNLLIILFGLIGYKYLGVREYPSIDPPVITVRTNYSGANADVIESQISEPLEKAINGIAGMDLDLDGSIKEAETGRAVIDPETADD